MVSFVGVFELRIELYPPLRRRRMTFFLLLISVFFTNNESLIFHDLMFLICSLCKSLLLSLSLCLTEAQCLSRSGFQFPSFRFCESRPWGGDEFSSPLYKSLEFWKKRFAAAFVLWKFILENARLALKFSVHCARFSCFLCVCIASLAEKWIISSVIRVKRLVRLLSFLLNKREVAIRSDLCFYHLKFETHHRLKCESLGWVNCIYQI